MKRKTLVSSLIILFVLMGTAFSSVSAESNNKVDNNNRVSNVTINEYQWAKKMNELSREELKDKGLSNEEIDSIRSYKMKFKDHYKKMANIPESQLENLGYTKEQS
ncbi:hypothetical protein NC797_11310 [Aquibacillus sp. 3ASR75-11]|uniref:DUF2680 domain-containing protein n=1 Tax=Terrihalobacillus insolitus TaxID=2950438 RepID=A0A9X4AMR9_9BACI|nr:hypothetical protein [Terrihalobacillus insolitus]MDC3425094.1 hypothetical protein [Terrihalobacillus insolitus]